MAQIPLRSVSWCYDDALNRVIAVFQEAPGDDDPDPISFVADRFFTIEFPPLNADSETRPAPEPDPTDGA